MTKGDFINRMAEKHDITKKNAAEVIEIFNSTLEDVVVSGESVSFAGLYSMGSKEKQAREGVNPRSGDRIVIPKMRVPYCKFGKNIKEAVKG